MEQLIKRENEIFNVLDRLMKEKLIFVIVGGYAVSSYKHRFSVDADIAIQEKDKSLFDEILKREGFKEDYSKELSDTYSSIFVRYVKKEFNVSIDVLINSVVCRQTNAAFSFELLFENSNLRKIIGIEKEVKVLVPKKEILIALKLHSGRLTDFRDVAALAKDTNLNEIVALISRGDLSIVRKNLFELNRIVNDKNFIDSFKGVFVEKKFDIDFNRVKRISGLKV